MIVICWHTLKWVQVYNMIYIQQLCEDTGCNPEDLPEAMKDREKWRERVRDIRATSTTWWWWWWYYMIKQFYWTERWNIDRYFQSELESTWEFWQWRDISHYSDLQDWKILSNISKTLVGAVFTIRRDAVGVSYSPSWLGWDGFESYTGQSLVVALHDSRDAVVIFYSPNRLGS